MTEAMFLLATLIVLVLGAGISLPRKWSPQHIGHADARHRASAAFDHGSVGLSDWLERNESQTQSRQGTP